MPIIHKDLYQILNGVVDREETFEISEEHDWMLGVQPEEGYKWSWDEDKEEPVIVIDTEYQEIKLEALRSAKIAYVTKEAEETIISGISSEVLGESYKYDTRAVDQINWEHALSQAKINNNPNQDEEGYNSSLPDAGQGWVSCCKDGEEVYSKIGHTEEQINILRSEFLIHKYTVTEDMNSKIEAIKLAETIEELEGLG